MSAIYVMNIDDVESHTRDALSRFVAHTFGFDAVDLSNRVDPASAYDVDRNQYSSVALMRALLQVVPENAVKLLALIDKDLFIPMLTFIFGHAQIDGPIALVSLARLRQEFYGLAPQPDLLLRRAKKETAHELGHSFGLTHCDEPTCCMSLSTSIELVDGKDEVFCHGCQALLRESLARTRNRLTTGRGREVLS